MMRDAILVAELLAGLGAGLAGGVFFAFGAVLVTMGRNVPLNRALAEATDASGPMLWRTYLRDWVKWNHVRTVTCAVACVLLVYGTALQIPRPIIPSYIADCMDLKTQQLAPCPPDDCPTCAVAPNSEEN
jgi:uncharacterized membrane protein